MENARPADEKTVKHTAPNEQQALGNISGQRRRAADDERDAVLFEHFDEVLAECRSIFVKKQIDYGPGNIAEGHNKFGRVGLLVRMNDKMQRLINLERGGAAPLNESVEDSFKDLLNYAAIALLCERGQWPGVENAD